MEPTYKVVGEPGTKPVGLCGSGIIDVISELFMCGIINPKGKFVREGERIRHDKYGMGSYVIAFEKDAGSVKDIEITEVDIDNFIRAKGAIFSAIRTMINSLDFDVSMLTSKSRLFIIVLIAEKIAPLARIKLSISTSVISISFTEPASFSNAIT